MTTQGISQEALVNFEVIKSMVKQGKSVISADDSTMIEIVSRTIDEGRTATFYLKPTVFKEIRKRYWTPERFAAADLQPMSKEEAFRIKSDFNLEIDGCSSHETCPRCESVYRTYEFIQQGMKEHGADAVRAVFALEGVAVLQVHPRQGFLCQSCGLDLTLMARLPIIMGGHSYDYWQPNGNMYACCL